ncbi:MAG: lytic transglycosylase domain-containing protein [Ferruginibacter sp.]
MELMLSLLKVSMKPITQLTVIFLIFNLGASAQKSTDSSKKVLLASLDKKEKTYYIVKEANVVYPEILKGNEAETLEYIEKFTNKRRDYLVRMYTKGKKMLPQATTILKKYDLPEEFKILLVLESAYNGNAVSKAGAVGYWQIMDEVAKEYGMKYIAQLSNAEKKKLLKARAKKGAKKAKLVKLRDDRKNFNIATHTAARYLRDRRRNLDDNWLLIVASYNCGVGNVWNAMKKTGLAEPTFWDVKKYLPSETQAYVMNFVALNVVFTNYNLFATNKLSFAPEKIQLPANLDEDVMEGIETER